MDLLSDILKVVKLEGALFFNGEFSAPWCLHSPPDKGSRAPALTFGGASDPLSPADRGSGVCPFARWAPRGVDRRRYRGPPTRRCSLSWQRAGSEAGRLVPDLCQEPDRRVAGCALRGR